MNNKLKSKIYEMLNDIEDEKILNQVMEDVSFYAKKEDIIDELSAEQVKVLDKAIEEADNKEIIGWDDFKKEMNEWKEK